MEIVGLLVGILGVVLAFEEPRRRVVQLFRRNSNFNSETEANSTEIKKIEQVNSDARRPIDEAAGPSKAVEPEANRLPGYGVFDGYEQHVLSFSTYPNGITLTQARKRFAASQESIEAALAKLESMQLVVVTRRGDGELHWKLSDAGRQFLKDNPYALYGN